MTKSDVDLKSLLMKVKEENGKVGLVSKAEIDVFLELFPYYQIQT